ncbi:hypothetical protein SDC9_207903 [bioreactor metagenome]|uniref:Zinc-ribbon domain-containing protein n=1 Tax=bioreactor metagenome TaxID=1076179 RepID=A0A645J941_9ZZZZ
MKDLQLMINKGYFISARLDTNKQQLVLPHFGSASAAATSAETKAAAPNTDLICKSCGARYSDSAQKFCEYCGSQLK